MSAFRAVLEDLMRTVGEAERYGPAGFHPDLLDAMTELQGTMAVHRRVACEGAYGEASIPPLPVEDLPDADPQTIATELGLHSGLDREELGRIRRRFASRNHPDRLPDHLREKANARMMIANMLIDQAERRCGASAP